MIYSVPDDRETPPVGARVVVPLGSRLVTGLVVAECPTADPPSASHSSESDASEPSTGTAAARSSGPRIRPIREVLDNAAFVPDHMIELARWTAEYYASGVGDTIPMLLPTTARGARADAHKTLRVVSITAQGLDALNVTATAGCTALTILTVKQREALELLAASPGGIPAPALAARALGSDTVSRLARHGYVSVRRDRIERDPFSAEPDSSKQAKRLDRDSPEIESPRKLTIEQSEALDRLRALHAARAFRVALLHGVTGSGKTEIYLRLAAEVRSAGRGVLMLVPEIALTPAIAWQLRHAFGERVAIQHSSLSSGERHDQWQRIRRGQVDVVVGTRSAVFAPLEHVGLIVVDEEHDSSYKQEESPRYNGRDVAIVRGQRSGALVVLGSATPSMETYYHALSGKYERVVLERRVLDRPLASVTIVDMREEYAAAGPELILSRALRETLAERLQARQQALVLLNRRGFATAVFCRQCAGTLDCPNCSVSLVVHGEGSARRARCHYCNYTARVPTACPLCAGPYLDQAGFGTERVEKEIRRTFPDARVARLDRDAVRRRGALAALLADFRDGSIDVLVGTQMIAKGHDFPRVTLVGVVSADVGLGLADFRASERTFQLLTQVAGRAGRGATPGQAVIQTLYPDHYSIQLACRQDYAAFFERELVFRRSMRYPPVVSLVSVIIRGRTFSSAMDDAADIARRVRQTAGERAGMRVLGPAPAPLERLRGEYRAQLLVKGTNRKRVREVLQAALAVRRDLQRRIVIDVDPLNVL